MRTTTKYGNITYRVKLLKNYEPEGFGTTYKKGSIYAVELGSAGIPYITAGHGLAIYFPPTIAKLITVQNRLPEEISKHIARIKRALGHLAHHRARYYDDVFTTKDILALEKDVTAKLKALKHVKAPKRPKAAK